MAYAHSNNDRGEPQDLVSHLRGVAELAALAAADMGCAEIGHFLGLWHDAGKFSTDFQSYLAACMADPSRRGHGPDHKAAGALLTAKHLGPMSLLVQGHHGGLKSPTDFQSWVSSKRSEPSVAEATALAVQALPDLMPRSNLSLPAHVLRDPLAAELFLRMTFSALVDGDFLDTERHFNARGSRIRGVDVTIEELWSRFESYHIQLHTRSSGVVAEVRRAVYEACLAAAGEPPGLFRLTVPTGGGKTLSGMAFALRHALKHGHKRVVVAIPFISITEQTADVYRRVFGVDPAGRPAVLEHHSAAFDMEESEEYETDREWQRLATENWDAPIIVTTTVQLFESLFANGTSRCRKLHHLARSVIILDEAQSLPPHLLQPVLHALRELCINYGTTVVVSTATQPAFDSIPVFKDVPATEIVPDPGRYFEALRRVSYEWRTDPSLSWDEVAGIMREEPQALAIVNTKKDALALLSAMDDPQALHLSTLLCGAHRRAVLERVKGLLAEGKPCRLVSTQVVEAGVDLDFPVVVRALGPLDGIIQAAGRCNREGQLAEGRVVVFRPRDGGIPAGAYRTAVGVTGSLLGGGSLDPDDPQVSGTYFGRLFAAVNTDREGIQKLRASFDYPEVSRRFRMIDDDTESVAIIGYGTAEERTRVRDLLDCLSGHSQEARLLLRRLQPYLVTVRRREAEKYRRRGLVSPVMPGLGEWLGAYDPVRGLTGEDPDPDSLVI